MQLLKKGVSMVLFVSLLMGHFAYLPKAQAATTTIAGSFSATPAALLAGFSEEKVSFNIYNKTTLNLEASNISPGQPGACCLAINEKELEMQYNFQLATAQGFRVSSVIYRDANFNTLTSSLHPTNTNRVRVTPVAGDTIASIVFDTTATKVSLNVAQGQAAQDTEDKDPQFTLSLDKTASTDVTVNFTVSGSAISGGVDFTAPGQQIIAAGQSSKTFTVDVNDDTVSEQDETIILTISSVQNAELGSTISQTYTVKDNDGTPNVQFQNATQSIAENASPLPAVTALLSKASSQTITVPLTINFTGTGAGFASASDVALSAGSLVFAPGELTKTVSYTFTNDALVEGSEVFQFVLGTPTPNGSATIGTQGNTTITVTDDETPPVINFAPAASSDSESTTSKTATVTLDKASTLTVTVTVNSANGTASAPADYSAITNQVVTFNPGDTSKTVALTIADDPIDEPNETFTLTLSSPVNGILGSTTTHTVTIQDNDQTPTVQFSSSAQSIAENVGTGNVSVTLSNPSSQAITVIANASSGTALSGTDFAAISNLTVNFAAGETSQNIVVTPTNDAFVEGSETFTIALSSPTNATLGSTTTSTITITDDEPVPTLNFSSATSSGAENVTPVTFTVTLSAASTLTVTVKMNSADGSASAGTDYTAISNQTLTFNPGETSKTVSLTIAEDSTDEPDETLTLTISTPTNATLGTTTVHTYTIQDNDATPTINFSAAASSGLEPTSPILTVTLSNPSSQTITVKANSANGTAVAPGDYTAITDQTITFNPGETSKTLNLTIVDDSLAEGSETLTVTLSAPTNATLGTTLTHTNTIQDNDLPSITFNTASSAGSEGLNPAVITVVLDKPSTQSITVTVNSANGTALSGQDYTAISSQTITFAAGETSKNVSVTIAEDTSVEGNETFTLTLSNPTNSVLGSTSTHTYTILDNDLVAPPVINFQSSASSGSESVTTVNFTLVLDKTSTQAVTVQVSTSNGSAVAPGDYTALSNQTITFNAGELSKSFSVTVADDSTVESNETFTLSLNNAQNSSIGTTNPTHTYTVVDNDVPVINFQAGSSSGAENVSPLNLTITLDKVSNQTVTVQVNSANGTAIAPGDYTAIVSQTVTFNAGETSKTLPLTVIDDTLGEGNETLTLSLANATNATIGTVSPSHVYTITDNDTPAVNFSAGTSSTAENASPLNLTVTISNSSALTVTVIASTANGTALSPGDFTAISNQTITFAPGELSKTLPVTIIDDTTGEPSETFTVTLSSPSNATLGTTVTHTATITDNDSPVVNFLTGSSSGSESITPAVFTLTLSNASTLAVSVTVNSANGTAVATGDFTALVSQVVNFAAGETSKTFNVTIVDDTAVESNESLTLTISGPSNATLGPTVTHTYTILDNDGGSADILVTKPQGLTVGEEGAPGITVTVALSVFPSANVVIPIKNENESELTVTPASLTFTPTNGTTAQIITIVGKADGIPDGNKKTKVKLEPAQSTDTRFNGKDGEDLEVITVDRDVTSSGSGSGGGGGGGSSALITIKPTVNLLSPEGKTVNKVTVHPGEEARIPVEVNDKNPHTNEVSVKLVKDPSKGKAVLDILKKENKYIAALLRWTPTENDIGSHDFVLELKNSYTSTQETITITVTPKAEVKGTETKRPLKDPKKEEDIPSNSPGTTSTETEETKLGRILERRTRCQFADTASEAVIMLCALGLIDQPNSTNNYYEESKSRNFDGAAKMNRAEFTKILVNSVFDETEVAAKKEEIENSNLYSFIDVEPNAWYSPYIAMAKEYGIVKGYTDGTFIPWRPIERSEAFKILIGVVASRNDKIRNDLEKAIASGNENDPWYAPYDRLVNLYGGFSTPADINSGITLSKSLSREEGAEILYKVIQNAGIQTDDKLSKLREKVALVRRKKIS